MNLLARSTVPLALLISMSLITVVYLLANAAYFPRVEEPRLERRFGDPYREYRRHVRRWLPRLRAWQPPARAPAEETR